MKIKRLRTIVGISLGTIAGLIAAAEAQQNHYGPSGGAYAPGDRMYRHGGLDDLHPRDITVEEARLQEVANYKGIEGARLAHRLYRADHAETLDGQCEPQIVVGKGENLHDVAALCDKPYLVLAELNQNVLKSGGTLAGKILNIPHGASGGDMSGFKVNYFTGQQKGSVQNIGYESTTAHDRLIAPSLKSVKPRSGDTSSFERIGLVRGTGALPSFTLSVDGLEPKAPVQLFSGPNKQALVYIGEVKTDAKGSLLVTTRAPGHDGQSVVYAARQGDTMIYSKAIAAE